MQEWFDLRITEPEASEILDSDEGKTLSSGLVRKVLVERGSEMFVRMRSAYLSYAAHGSWPINVANVTRQYLPGVLESAPLLLLRVTSRIETSGELCGTVYDYSNACVICGAGRRLTSEYRLDVKRLPKRSDVTSPFAEDELLVSGRVRLILEAEAFTGQRTVDVIHHPESEIKQVMPAEAELIELARARGIDPKSVYFDVFCARPENAHRMQQWMEAHARAVRDRPVKAVHTTDWRLLEVTSSPVRVAAPTRAGHNYFDEDDVDEFRCPRGDSLGLGLLSELYVDASTWDGSDVVRTAESIGCRRGTYVPSPKVVVSQKVYRAFLKHKVKGCSFEVAHLV